ncbi:shikimate kinase [Candidatus Margulisiibacteriota bacterium]
MKSKNVILIGFMGVGKTEIGKKLAEKLGLAYIDTDDIIESRAGKTINNIFTEEGEAVFRDIESGILDELAGKSGQVVSTGGGMILRPENVKKMKGMGPLVLLWASPEVIHERVKNAGTRPLLNVPDPMKKIDEILEFRTPIYKSVADLEVDTSRLSPEEACNKIVEFLGKGK